MEIVPGHRVGRREVRTTHGVCNWPINVVRNGASVLRREARIAALCQMTYSIAPYNSTSKNPNTTAKLLAEPRSSICLSLLSGFKISAFPMTRTRQPSGPREVPNGPLPNNGLGSQIPSLDSILPIRLEAIVNLATHGQDRTLISQLTGTAIFAAS